MKSSARLAIVVGLELAAAALFSACGSNEPYGAPADKTEKVDAGTKSGFDAGQLRLTYSQMYSAYVEGGAHEAQVRLSLTGRSPEGQASFTSSDPLIAAVSSVDSTSNTATIVVQKDGEVVITADVGGIVGRAKLTITKYTEVQWLAGQTRYTKSELAIVPADGGALSLVALVSGGMRNANGGCTTCHSQQAKVRPKLETSPLQIAGYSDDELITIFTMGKKPDNVALRTLLPTSLWGMNHSWTVTEEEQQGLIAFMRTQPPRLTPDLDFVMLCPGAPAPADGGAPALCDNDGNPIMLPGSRIDAGTTTLLDAGRTAMTGDADTDSTGDAH